MSPRDETYSAEWTRWQQERERRRAQTEHRKPPLYRVPRGQCRWCGLPTAPRLKKDGAPHAQQRNWHPDCVLDHGIAANSTTAYGAVASRDGERCADCGAAPTYEPGREAVPLEVDHEIPLWKVRDLPHRERREYFRLPNLKLRCVPCHKAKTAREAAERAAPPTEEIKMAKKMKPDDGPAIGGIAADRLRSFVERIERLEEEKSALSDDIKEVKAEAKSNGFDIKTLNEMVKLRRMDAGDRDDREHLRDLYKRALGMLADTPLGEAALRVVA